jgi:hypothetical protein
MKVYTTGELCAAIDRPALLGDDRVRKSSTGSEVLVSNVNEGLGGALVIESEGLGCHLRDRAPSEITSRTARYLCSARLNSLMPGSVKNQPK